MADYTIQGADPRWKRFEKLVARMLATLSTGAEVVDDDAIRGTLSEAERQIDVSVRSRVDGVEQLVIVQCRDYNNPLDVNVVGEFDSVIRDVGATKGIIVSVQGFTETAKTYARALKIDLLRLVDAEQKIWGEYFGDQPATFHQIVSRNASRESGRNASVRVLATRKKNWLDVPSPKQTPTRPLNGSFKKRRRFAHSLVNRASNDCAR